MAQAAQESTAPGPHARNGGGSGGSGGDCSGGSGGNQNFDSDDRGIDDLAGARMPLREYLGEQLRLSFFDPVDRMVGAHLIALLCPAGRLTAAPADIATANPYWNPRPVERTAIRALLQNAYDGSPP